MIPDNKSSLFWFKCYVSSLITKEDSKRKQSEKNLYGINSSRKINKVDNLLFTENANLVAKLQLVDFGDGRKFVNCVENDQLKPVGNDDIGVFFTNKCYVVIYSLMNGFENFIYIWIGDHSLPKDRKIAQREAVKLDENEFS
ncbi:Advillin-like protein, partial [Leptotrombidium deliense]